MRIGIFLDDFGRTLDEALAEVKAVVAAGHTSLWIADRLAWDPLTLLTIAGRENPGLSVGTAIVRTYPRHPLTLASQALSVQAATGNRLTLGIGPSHQTVIEGQYGYSFDKPARHVREYLTALLPLLRGESVSYQGETLRAEGQITIPGAQPPAVLLSALGPAMLKVAGELTDGTITTWAGPKSLSEHFVPVLAKAAAGRPAPRVVASVCVSVTGDPAGTKARLSEQYQQALSFPSYRGILEREGVTGVGDTAVAGDETAVLAQLRRFADAGATDLIVIPVGSTEEQARTAGLLTSATW